MTKAKSGDTVRIHYKGTLGDGTEFIETIWSRETTVMRRLMAGDKEPFLID